MTRIEPSPNSRDPWDASSPLAPFLASLDSTSIRPSLRDHHRIQRLLARPGGWSIPQLRSSLCALLARDEDQQTLFLRRFDRFFAPPRDEPAIDDDRVARVREGLDRLAEQRAPRPLDSPRETERRPHSLPGAPMPRSPQLPPPRRRSGRWALAATLIVVGVVVLWIALSARRQGPDPPEETTTAEQEARQDQDEPEEASILENPDRRQRNDPAPRLVEVSRSPVDEIQDLPWTSALAGGSLVTTLLYVAWLSRRRPPQEPPTWDPEGPRFFDSGAVGPPREPWLDRDTLDRLADSLGFFAAPQASRRLDLDGSVRATAQHGGEPHLVFEPRRRVHRVVVLHDLQTESLRWNSTPGELARGLERRGVPVIQAWFSGAPTGLRTADGGTFHLDDLEDQRQHHLVLIFGDALGVDPQRHRLLLENLARWPMLAWFEPREPGLWRPVMARLAESGIRCYPATAEALRSAFDQLVSERGVGRERLLLSRIGHLDGRSRAPLPQQVERLLGDALPWAEACALLEPPVGLGLAEALRRFLAPELPPIRLGRLMALPGSELRNGGLHLAPEVRRVLRAGFEERNSPTQHQSVVDFLLEQMQGAEPTDPASLQHLAWAWRYERLRFENAPEAALESLVGLRRGPHGARVRESLLGSGSSAAPAPIIAPRLTTARSRALWRQLDSDRASGLPLPRWQFALLIAMLVATGVSLWYFGDDLIEAQSYSGRTSDVVVENATDETVWVGGRLPENPAERLVPLAPGERWDWVVDDLTEQVVEVHGLFHQDSRVVSAAITDRVEMRVEADTQLSPCFERLGPRSWVERCPPRTEDEPADGIVTVDRAIDRVNLDDAGRLLTLLEVSNRAEGVESTLVEHQWQTGWIDAIYRAPLPPLEDPDSGAIARALEPTLREIHTRLLGNPVPTQVYWWVDGSTLPPKLAQDLDSSLRVFGDTETLVYNRLASGSREVPQLALLPNEWNLESLQIPGVDSASDSRVSDAWGDAPATDDEAPPTRQDGIARMPTATSFDEVPGPRGTFDGTGGLAGLPVDTDPATDPAATEVDSTTPQQAARELVSQQAGRLVDSTFAMSSTLDFEASQGLELILSTLTVQFPPTRAPLATYVLREEGLTLGTHLGVSATVSLAVRGGESVTFFRDRQPVGFGTTFDDTPKGSGPWTYLAVHDEPGVLKAGTCLPGFSDDRIQCAALSGELTVYRDRRPGLVVGSTDDLGRVEVALDFEEGLTFCPPDSTWVLRRNGTPLADSTEFNLSLLLLDTPDTPSPWLYRLERRMPSGVVCDMDDQVGVQTGNAIRLIVQDSFPVDTLEREALSRVFLRQTRAIQNLAIAPIDQLDGSQSRTVFNRAVHEQPEFSIKTYWSARSDVSPPPEAESDTQVIQYVLGNPGGIGYVASDTSLPPGIKTLRVVDAVIEERD